VNRPEAEVALAQGGKDVNRPEAEVALARGEKVLA
jgi:hypothetical protein